MSDTEKRGRLAVMEAAISASLSHPNIVRTFTYSLIPMRNQHSTPSSRENSASQLPSGQCTHLADSSPLSQQSTSSGDRVFGPGRSLSSLQLGSVFAFEVQIVLEFCDLETLQSALDSGAFFISAFHPGRSVGKGETNLLSSDVSPDISFSTQYNPLQVRILLTL